MSQSESSEEDAMRCEAKETGYLIAGKFLLENVEDVRNSAATKTTGELHRKHEELKIIFPYPAIISDTQKNPCYLDMNSFAF